MLWAADGINRPSGRRTAPSAGATYPIELYVVTAEKLLHYVPAGHRVEVLAETAVTATLGLPGDHAPLYLIPVGAPG